MSLLRKALLAVIMLGGLSACGFEPMYGQNNVLNVGFAIESPTTPLGRTLKMDLEDKLNPHGVPANPAYRLKVGITSNTAGVGVARDGTASRYNVSLNSSYELVRSSDHKTISSGAVRHLASYNNQTNNYFSTTISERDATKRGVEELAEMYRQRMAALLSNPDANPSVKPEALPAPAPNALGYSHPVTP